DGDADEDGDVDGGDLLAWQQQFGSGAVVGAVPEPAAGALATLAAAGLLVSRRRSKG
ncbi:MAG: PEP-CTERM sorting domain-containing protein, partial [Pirellulales bacterium]|nr:PEP-CTERM sorting domain-containing protein [Pirellulales bacterium]